MRWRIEYEKGSAIKFLSHLDMVRVWERLLRRSGVTVGLSQGFNPHLKLSLGTVLPVGLWGRREYLDMQMDGEWQAAILEDRFNRVLPPGIRLGGLREIPMSTPALMAAINLSAYRIAFDPVAGEVLARAVQTIEESKNLVIIRPKDGKEADIRLGIKSLQLMDNHGQLELEARLATGGPQSVRFPELVVALKNCGVDPQTMTDFWREANYIETAGKIRSPLDLE